MPSPPGSSGGGRGRLSNRGSSTVNIDAMAVAPVAVASSSKRKAPPQKQLPPLAKKSPSKRSPSSSSISPSSASSASTSTATSNDDQNQNVRVVARLRPLSMKEIDENGAEATKASGRQIIVEGQRNFEYDAVFGPQTTQEEVYKATAGDTVEKNVFRGFNVTILAYGQTGAGKSYTMGTAASTADSDGNGGGDDTSESNADSSLKPPSKGDGIIGRAVYDLFKTRASLPNGTERVKVEMSYLEIYNEEARDLMYSGTKPPELRIRDSTSEGVVVRNLSRHVVSSPTDVANLMSEAAGRRVTASTQMNAVSSRSHAVCTLYVTIAPPTADCDEKKEADGNSSSSSEELKAKLTLVDLAGSERIKRTGAEGARMREGININKGLFVLGQVVSALSELGQQQSGSSSSNNAHIPYRDSKLTRLLQDSLGGNSRTVMVACVSPAESNVEESINTLRYAERARNIKNNATRNVIDRAMSPAEAAALRRENQMLKLQLLQAQMANSSAPVGAMILGTRMPAPVGVNGALVADHGADDFTGNNSLLNGIDVEKLEIVTRLRANITSMETKVAQLEQRSVSSAEDALVSAFRADKWRQRYESLTTTLAAKGIDLPEEVRTACTAPNRNGEECETLVMQLRRELSDLKEQLRDSQTDAEVARAMAAAVIAGDGDLTAAEHLALAEDEALVSGGSGNKYDINAANNDNESDESSNEHTTKLSELMAVDGEIGRKEELMDAMTKERNAMDALKGHFQSTLLRLQEEVDALSSERESLLRKFAGGGGAGSVAGKMRGPGGVTASARSEDDENPERKRMRARIAELEDRIRTLKKKSAEHTKSIRMREAAERKCSQLAAEIAADKRRRAGLQKELKELSTQRRQEKKVAQQQAARMLRDSQKMKSELQKVKDQAARQSAVLRRKAAEAVSKQKQAEEKQKKRNSAVAIRTARVTNNNSVGIQRKEELNNWLEKEIGAAISISDIEESIEEQTGLIQEATMRKNEMAKSKRESAAALQSLEIEIGTRKSVIIQLEKNLEEVYKSVLGNNAKAASNAAVHSSSSCFVDLSTWQGLTRQEMRLIHANTFSRLVDVSKDSATLRAQAKDLHNLAVSKAISEERKRADEVIMRLKMDHSEAMMTLLESTKESVQHQLRQDLTAIGVGEDGLDETTKASIDAMLASYLSGCERVGQTVKNSLNDVREKHDSMKAFVDQVAKGIIAKNEASALLAKSAKEDKKKAAKKKSSPSPEEESDFDLFEDDDDDDAGAYEDSDDSDWSPDTPAPKRKKTKTDSSKPRNSFSDDDEEHQLAGEKILSRPDVSHEKNEDASSGASEAAAPSSSPEAVEMESLTVAELKSRLKACGLTQCGRKAELIKRLRATGAGGGTPAIHENASTRVTSSASSLVASTNNTVAAEENFSSSSRSSSTSVKLGTPKSASSSSSSSSSSASSSSSKDQSSVLGRPPRKRPAPSAGSAPPSASVSTSASARTSSTSSLTKHARQPGGVATADVLTASAKKRRRRSMTRAVEQMEVEMANIAEEKK